MQSFDLIKERFIREMEICKQLSKSTIINHRYVLASFITFLNRLGVQAFNDVTKDGMLEYFQWGKQTRGWGKSTLQKHYMNLSVFYKWLMQESIANQNPIKLMPKPKVDVTVPVSLSTEQSSALLAAAMNEKCEVEFERTRNYAIVATLLMTGMRRGELAKLKLVHLNLELKEMRLVGTKTGYDRIMPLHPDLLEVLKEYLVLREKFLTQHDRESTALFVSVAGHALEHMTPDGVSRVVKRLVEAAGLPDFVSAHKLRHTFATQLLNGTEERGGVDVTHIQRLLGHRKLTTTAIYLNATTKDLAREILKHPTRLSRQPSYPMNSVATELQES